MTDYKWVIKDHEDDETFLQSLKREEGWSTHTQYMHKAMKFDTKAEAVFIMEDLNESANVEGDPYTVVPDHWWVIRGHVKSETTGSYRIYKITSDNTLVEDGMQDCDIRFWYRSEAEERVRVLEKIYYSRGSNEEFVIQRGVEPPHKL